MKKLLVSHPAPMLKIDVTCKVCHAPSWVECDPAGQVAEGLLKLYTCDSCMARRYGRRTPRPQQTEMATAPHNDP